ncbi:cytochrome P450 [Actinocrispum sp. NPDC049592]|uniref:cytochrome P450 n=1 Tax=Actinocrispum sp. NPDC049592 TaxID=3154835 RepID=UPI003431AE6B
MTAAPDFPQARTCPYHPAPGYAAFRDGQPLHRATLHDGRQTWVVSGHAEARHLLADPRVSADRERDGFPFTSDRFVDINYQAPSFITQDDPQHSRIRRMLIPEFTARRLKDLEPGIQETVDAAIDNLLAAGPPADLVTHFSLPIPSMVICRLLGVPYEDHGFFEQQSREIMRGGADENTQALMAVAGYLTAMAEDPPPGLIARLKAGHVDTGELTTQELAFNAMLLLVAGHETTASLLSLAVITLLEHPGELALMREHPRMVPGAVDELLRYLSILDDGPARIATQDIEIGGVTIKAGDGVIVVNSVVNRDPAVFADPDRFDVTRSARHHLAFGYGVHQCLGQNLARMEIGLALSALFDQVPTLRPAVPVEELNLRDATMIQGVGSLPVTW